LLRGSVVLDRARRRVSLAPEYRPRRDQAQTGFYPNQAQAVQRYSTLATLAIISNSTASARAATPASPSPIHCWARCKTTAARASGSWMLRCPRYYPSPAARLSMPAPPASVLPPTWTSAISCASGYATSALSSVCSRWIYHSWTG